MSFEGVAPSSGGAEYCGVARAAGIGLGMQAFDKHAGATLTLRFWTDSPAAMRTSA